MYISDIFAHLTYVLCPVSTLRSNYLVALLYYYIIFDYVIKNTKLLT